MKLVLTANDMTDIEDGVDDCLDGMDRTEEFGSDLDEEERLDYIKLQLEALHEQYGETGLEDDPENDDQDSELPETCNPPPAVDRPAVVPEPAALKTLREKLKGGYKCPPFPPLDSDEVRNNFRGLTQSETYSLRHFIIWKKTGGTIVAYKLHSKFLESVSHQQNVHRLSLAVGSLGLGFGSFGLGLVPCARSCGTSSLGFETSRLR